MPIEINNPKERKKVIGAAVLGLVAIILLWWTFFGFGDSSSQTPPRAGVTPTPTRTTRTASNPAQGQVPAESRGDLLDQLRPVNWDFGNPAVPEARRNIFVYYEPPVVIPKPSIIPTPTPTPIPPALLANLSPAMVFARTGDFTLEIAGDKFTPGMRVVIDGNELPTRFLSPQQVSATVPASQIANPGSRQVMLRTPDGKVYSNSATLNIGAPPTPNYTYIGIIGTPRYIDTAILQDKSSKEILNIQRGDLVGGRFRLTSISEKELVLIDNNLKIKHTLAFSTQGDRSNPLQRPTPRIESEDDEP
ncbi:MAG TPA: IPT/TIG domain-containing protein [Pyrinomonadaceae bacterium]|nr:IPT/TIG domain-containing protein [Pyrinomonadaceae bacterium]